jgi:hypothetical protein
MESKFDDQKLRTAIQQIPEIIKNNPNKFKDESSFKEYLNENESLSNLEQQWNISVQTIENFFKDNHKILVKALIISKIEELKQVGFSFLMLSCFWMI